MEIATTFTTTPKTVVQSYRACHRLAYAIQCALPIVLVILSVIARSVVPALIGLVYFAIAELSVRRQLKPFLVGPQTVTITMTDNEYRTETTDRSTTRTWTTFSSVDRVGAFWVLRLSNTAAMALPRTALDQTQTAAFEDLVRRKGLLG